MQQRFFLLALSGLVSTLSPNVSAQSTGKAAAETLFAEGKRLMTAGNYDEACPKFRDSQKADPAVGTRLNLALCYKKAGLTASAWTEYKAAAAAARTAGQSARERLARKEASALEAVLKRVWLQLPDAAQVPALKVSVDGTHIPHSLLNMPMPVDPGPHRVTASAPGHVAWSHEFSVDADETRVEIPRLVPLAKVDHDGDAQSPYATWAWVSYGVGAAGLGAGVFGLLGSNAAQEKLANRNLCDADRQCLPEAQEHIDADAFYQTLSIAGFAAGAVGVAVGTTLLFIPGAEEHHPAKLEAYVTPGLAGVRGTF